MTPKTLLLGRLSLTRFSSVRAFSSVPGHQLNINNALKKKDETLYFNDLLGQPSNVLQGIGPKHHEELEALGLTTVDKLADYKFFHLARCMKTLASVEEEGGRSEDATMNLNFGLMKDLEHLSFQEMLKEPVHTLQGITPTASETFHSLGVKTIEDLAEFRYCKWAEAIKVAARFEEIN